MGLTGHGEKGACNFGDARSLSCGESESMCEVFPINLNQSYNPNIRLWRLSADSDADEWNKILPNFTLGVRLAFKL